MIQTSLRSILVATDLGESSEEVVRSAATLAAAVGAELHVLHALDLDSPPYGLEKDGPILSFPERIEYAEHRVDETVRRVVPPGVGFHTRVINYTPHKAILDYAAGISAELIVLGPHGSGGIGTPFLGTTADRVIRAAEVPCLIVRGPLTLPPRQVGVPVDFSEPGRSALDVALRWVPRLANAPDPDLARRPELRVFHVGWTVARIDSPALPKEEVLPRLQQEVKEALHRTGVSVEPRIRTEVVWDVNPAAAITRFAREEGFDLLILGTHGYGGLKRFLIGSVASGVAREAPCPVLLVPPALSD